MARKEKHIDPTTSPVAELAFDMRAVRDAQGIKYREMSGLTGLSASTLSVAANGVDLPSWEVFSAYLGACGENPSQWRERYLAVAAAHRDVVRRARAGKQGAYSAAPEPTPVSLDAFRRNRTITPVPHREPVPVPFSAQNPLEFVDGLNAVRVWAGNPSLRVLSARAGLRLPHSTLHGMLNRTTLPRWEAVEAFLDACGVHDQERVREWARVWRRLADEELHRRRHGVVVQPQNTQTRRAVHDK